MSANFCTVFHSLSFPGIFLIYATVTNLADHVILAAGNGMGDASAMHLEHHALLKE